MNKPKQRTALLLSLALAAGLTSLALTPPAEAKQDQALEGNYIVAHSIEQPTGLWIRMWTQEQSTHLRCVLPKAEESQQVWCPTPGLSLPVYVVESGEYTTEIAVDFVALAVWADQNNYDLQGIDASDPQIEKAEAEWLGFPDYWVCNIEQTDIDKCNTTCGASGVDSLSAEPYPANTHNPSSEPQCEVTCECNNSDLNDDWIDPPEVVTST